MKWKKIVRDYRNIECGLYWRFDVILDEDHSINHLVDSINNLAILRKIVLSLALLFTAYGLSK